MTSQYRLELPAIADDILNLTGKLILLFASVEWFIANVLLLSQISSFEHEKFKDHPLTQKYFESLLNLSFRKKLEGLDKLDFDTTKLREISEYRNILSHGLIFDKKDGVLTIKKITQFKAEEKELNTAKISQFIELLQIEGGKLHGYLIEKGYTYHYSI